MAYLTWTSDLDTGIDVIDGQHRQIVNYINQLYDAQRGHDREAVRSVIESTIDYTVSHFGFEEALMEDAGYEFSRPHAKVHELFIRRVSDFRLRFDAGEDVGAELHGLLARWLFGHIRNDDAAYVRAVRANVQDTAEQERRRGWMARSLGRFFRRH